MRRGAFRACAGALALVLATTCTALADVPLPGQHSARAKFWPSIRRWVVNFSPYAFNGPIVGLHSDGAGGAWFGVGQTVEHVTVDGRMMNYVVSSEPLWQVWSIATDTAGRMWFALGQSGRIGTLDRNGSVHTRVLVPRRYNPDIRDITFARDGTLWFRDAGRRSVGRKMVGRPVEEISLPDGAIPVQVFVCAGRVLVTSWNSTGASHVYAAANDRAALRLAPFVERDVGRLACDTRGTIWFASPATVGYFDTTGRARTRRPAFAATGVAPTANGGVWLAGYRGELSMNVEHRLTLQHIDELKVTPTLTLPIAYGDLGGFSVANDGTIWFAIGGGNEAYSVVRLSEHP